ncbi:MAG: FG-GAP-like repeat-containing protein, partial [bacterium]
MIYRIQMIIYSLLVGFWFLFSGEVKANTWTLTTLGDFMRGKQEQVTCGVLPMEIYMVSKDVDLKLATVEANWYWSSWNAPDVGYYASPAFCDLDNDGDYDLLIGESNGNCYAYENAGSNINPIWTTKSAWNAPNVGRYASPTFCDLDNDGDYDLLIGEECGISYAYENTGNNINPTWTAKSAWNSPDVGQYANPAFCDLDNDEDYDLLIGEGYGTSCAYENTGNKTNPVWTTKPAWNAPDIGWNASPAFCDLDNDGDYDLLIGEVMVNGISYAYKNTGSKTNPIWTEMPNWNGPDVGSGANPAFCDLDNDGDYDLLIGEGYGISFAYENTGSNSNPIWEHKPGWDGPDVHDRAKPIFCDLDNDRDYDLMIYTIAYENTGSNTNPIWTAKPVWNTPDVGYQPCPAFCDLDNDGDYDLLIGSKDGNCYAYENIGNNANPIWTAKISWNVINVGEWPSPTICDLDGDGDYDLLIGDDYGNSFAYENTGNSTNPIWTAKPAWDGPRVGGYGWGAKPAFCDLDGDGDFDLMIGQRDGSPCAYENIGSKTNPIWRDKSDWNTPYVGGETKPAFCDLDGDGDFDLMIGAVSGKSWSIENIATRFTIGTFTSSVFGSTTNTLDWDIISWTETKPPNTNIVIEVRIGNTPIPDENWSEWNLVTNSTAIPNSNSKYIQLRGILSTTDLSQTPMIHNITLSYHFPLPIILVSPTAGQVGTLVTVVGTDFGATEVIRIDFGTIRTITSIITNASGTFTTVFTIDTQPYGTTTIIATGLTSGSKAHATFFVLPNISLLTPTEGTVGMTVTIAGNGYGKTEDIVIHFGTIRSIATSIASDAGTFSTTFTFPLMVRGTKTVTATGLKTLVSATAFFNVLCSTRLEIEPKTKIVAKNDEFGLDIWLKDVVNLAGLDVFLDFDHNRLEVLDDNPAEEGIQITQGDFPPQASLLYAGATNTTGQIAYSLILVPATNTATGSGILARIRFKAKAPGTATISFVFDKPDNRYTVLKDSDNQPIPVTTYGGTVTIFEYGSMEGYVIIDPPKDTGTNAGISITLAGVGTTSTGIGGYYTFPEVIPGSYTLQADTSGVSPGTITGIVVYPGTKTQVATLILLNGDSNNDGVVDIEDFMVLRSAYLSVIGDERWNEESDYNGDDRINIDDAMILRNSFFKTQPSPAPAPPAPAPPVKLPGKLAKTKLIFNPNVVDTFVGATFSVRVMLEEVEDLAACQVQFSFDPNLLEVINLTTGNIGLPVIKSQFGVGTVDYAAGLLEGKVSESGILAEIEFKVKNPGITYLTFDFNPTTHRMTKMLNINSQPILFDVNEVKVNAKAISPLDHFEFDKIDSPKVNGIPFNVKIKALDVGNNLVDYNDIG